MTHSSYVTSGNTTRVYDSSVTTSADLPAGTYRVQFSQMSGYSLERVDTMDAQGERIYGTHLRRLDRIFATYDRFDRSLGVMLSGDKGMGKSLMLRLIAERAQTKLGLPAILVDQNYPGIAQFLDTLGEALIIFDEFEKTFPSGRGTGGENAQSQFLGLFDGISTVKRIYTITTNSLNDTSDFLVNRPGRFHYHIRFDYPDADQVREYLGDNLPADCHGEIESVVQFTQRTKINFDHLRAIAFELSDGSSFKEIIGDLNIKRTERPTYRMEARLTDGTVLSEVDNADIFGDGIGTSHWYVTHGARFFEFELDPADLVLEGDKLVAPVDALILPKQALEEEEEEDADDRPEGDGGRTRTRTRPVGRPRSGRVPVEEIEKVTLSLFHGNSLRYDV